LPAIMYSTLYMYMYSILKYSLYYKV